MTSKYTLENYYNDLDNYGLEITWKNIISNMKSNNKTFGFIKIENIGEVYEIGLAHTNKIDKKELGKYYTPEDVADIMSKWLIPLKGNNICDVCCGTGNLILSYLKNIGEKKTIKLLENGFIYLYDFDSIALNICKETICMLYGEKYSENIHCVNGDFLSKNISLPSNSKVISNPPYFRIKEFGNDWIITNVIKETKEFYSAIMEKIFNQSISSAIITPYSFISGEHFSSLRMKMNEQSGFIVSFDNVPGNIFNGRKHGIFNSNSTNSVRAAITITNNEKHKGYRCSELIRFKSEERNIVLDNDFLFNKLGNKRQLITKENNKYYKCNKYIEDILNDIYSNEKINTYISNCYNYTICVPNTCRYFTVGSIKELDRTGKIIVGFETEEIRDIVYCFINSSICYLHWRLFDGGITYGKSLFNTMPIWISKLTEEEKKSLIKIAKEMQSKENDYLSYKRNAGVNQESIKFPIEYRTRINMILLNAINKNEYLEYLNSIHSNSISNERDKDNE